MLPPMEMGLDSQHGGLRCNRGGCNINLPTPGSRTGWVTYCRFLHCQLPFPQLNCCHQNPEFYNVFMLPFLSHLLCGPCGRESVTQGVCFACHVSLNCHFHPHPPCIRNGYYLWRSVFIICLQTDLSVSGRHEPAKVHTFIEMLLLNICP